MCPGTSRSPETRHGDPAASTGRKTTAGGGCQRGLQQPGGETSRDGQPPSAQLLPEDRQGPRGLPDSLQTVFQASFLLALV